MEKKGDYIEAEALRLTIPPLFDLFEDTPHEYLRKVVDDTREDEPRSSESVSRMPKISRDAWQELILAPERGGVVIAANHESSSKELGETDTGKEVWSIENNFVMADAVRLNLPMDLSSVFWNESPPDFLDPFICRTAGREVAFARTLFQTASNNPFRRPQRDGIEDNNERQLGELDTGKEVTDSIFQGDTMKKAATAIDSHPTLARVNALVQWIKFENLERPLSDFSPNRPRKPRKATDMRHANGHFQELSDQAGKPLISKSVGAINRLPANHQPTRVMGLNFELDCISSAIVPWRGSLLLLTYGIGDQKYEWVFRFYP